MNIRITYNTDTLEIINISISEGTTLAPEGIGVIDAPYPQARKQAIAIGLDILQVDEWAFNNLQQPTTPEAQKKADIRFGENLLLEFLAGQKNVSLDNATYRAVSETFKYAEAALRRGDITQARTELLNIELMPPVWTEDIKNYFIQKIDNYVGI